MPPFLDSNILIYFASRDPRAEIAGTLIRQKFVISIQTLNEFANVATRKLGMNLDEVSEISSLFASLAERVLPLDKEIHFEALAIAGRYRFSVYDSLIVAAALKAGCDKLYSEDMQVGQKIDGKLQVVNPF
jgi:predicted nucleic acid-binding protein